VRLIECADPPLATLIARDPKLRTLCTLVGDHHLAVPIEHETQFRHTLRTLGHTITAASDDQPPGSHLGSEKGQANPSRRRDT
jgi:hypothetical protein